MVVQRGVEHDFVIMLSNEELQHLGNALDRCLEDENVPEWYAGALYAFTNVAMTGHEVVGADGGITL